MILEEATTRGAIHSWRTLWQIAIEITKNREGKNYGKRIHKGTVYYFWRVTCILKEDFEKGFLLMHQNLDYILG